MMFKKRPMILISGLLLILVGAFFCFINWLTTSSQSEFGVTFSTIYTKNLGLEVNETYLALLDDLKVRRFRLPVYWSEIEPTRGNFNWTTLDFLVSEAEARDVKLTLAIGRKVPRWPECFIPDWAEGLTNTDAEEVLLKMERTVVERYKNSPAVERWQIENEPFFPFGICPASSKTLFNQELALVRRLDQRPIMITVSGELDPWLEMAYRADVLGFSMYRVSWNPVFGLFPYPLPPLVYRVRSLIIKPFVDKLVVSELQAEPWFTKSLDELTDQEKASAFTSRDLQNNVAFVSLIGADEVYLWGAEWWYLEKLAGRSELWETARELFK
ncbi:MAG: hypothetical protein V1664_02415 [Candidatus Uhrbacteria bacterium]